ncbi:GH25 family lysozyme [Actinacidiphila sp. ITFR-21]|uniref:GH25 family lysozyme n=1 Tax=Actinacidiphila sp. ITFR-21 TaxID=3075199 RepID=UPI002889B1DD|nr:GH25 family lysozyme [Streptomyces sp. ITFR-21]WNI19182.1 GH25 family lysozyme [Streptomyces sp. ITFR-21]
MTGCQGQDWASYQATNLPTAGLGFVFVKATEGTGYTNPKYAAQIAHARAAGLVVGSYHYPHMAADPAAEVTYFLANAKPQPGDVLALDWEGYDDANKSVPMARQIAYRNAFLARLAAAAPHNQVGTYCNADYLNRDPNGTYGDFLWIATAKLAAGLPGINHSWLFHQYGTAGGIDHDYCPLTPAQLKTWAHAKEDDIMALSADDKTWLQNAVNAAVKAQIPAIAKEAAHQVAIYQWASPVSGKPTMLGSFLAAGDQHTQDILAAVKTAAPALTDDQVQALAAALASNPGLATAIATASIGELAARLQS